ncbi:MAG: hypothetical protein KA383_07015 [Phycisphaerae bacterium]|nr:hypothetical protein [Phycisphaerae bacterium]HPM84380.1 hypothetical protein [Candidatus Anammoximicrobium sp.]
MAGRSCRRWAVWMLAGTLWLASGGCPIDQDLVVTETTRAALQAAVDSLVEALAQYLAGN